MHKFLQSRGFKTETLLHANKESKSPITVIRSDDGKAVGVIFDRSAPKAGDKVLVEVSENGSRTFGVFQTKSPAFPDLFTMVSSPSESASSQDLVNAVIDYLHEIGCTTEHVFR